ncbi:hypothetical protein HNP86_001779 [Methanococcus maripaludis]|uniref:Uncharacterized protein n=1 Tax=Methanococcus maripaludis TaxID=39152 RepID=A0A7J9NVC4_METMI|nr:hypothetical protein [Methanococcus maripaludis]MBA2851620.1 hypothetical protein [Methanococcus maripaludis]
MLYSGMVHETGEVFYMLTSKDLYAYLEPKDPGLVVVTFRKLHKMLTSLLIYVAADVNDLPSSLPLIINGYPYMHGHVGCVYEIDGNYVFMDALYLYYYALRDTSFAIFGDFLFEDGEGYYVDDAFKTESLARIANRNLRVMLRKKFDAINIKRITPNAIYNNNVTLRV